MRFIDSAHEGASGIAYVRQQRQQGAIKAMAQYQSRVERYYWVLPADGRQLRARTVAALEMGREGYSSSIPGRYHDSQAPQYASGRRSAVSHELTSGGVRW